MLAFTFICPHCGATVEARNEPDEKPDGTLLGYLEADCDCGHDFTEEELLELQPDE